MIDLHVHSVFSDGTETPEELARAAVASGIKALALTDHDTAAGCAQFLAACRRERVFGVAGVELSAQVPMGTLHILGLGIDPESSAVGEALERVRESRDERNRRIVEKLNELGFNLTWDEVMECAATGVAGRPHIARAMIARGWAESVSEVFERYIGEGAPAYVDRFRLSPNEAVETVIAAGGAPVVAHPFSWMDDAKDLEDGLRGLRENGLVGIEVYHPSQDAEDELELLRIAKRLGLLASGGTDYHGKAVRPEIELGRGSGSTLVPDDILAPLVEKMSPRGFVKTEEGII